jgi:cobalt/nickel transport protein
MRTALCLALTCIIGASPAAAHYNMLLPSAASGKKDEAVTFTYQWGHPFEHELFDAPRPDSVIIRAPDGKTEGVKNLEEIKVQGKDKMVTAWRFRFTPMQRGDYVVVLKAKPIFLEEDGEFVQDTAKVVYHVQAQKSWDGMVHKEFEWSPLTRPYGLQAGIVFQAVLTGAAGTLVEVEHYSAMPPKELPPDEFITRTVKTDPNGVATCNLPEAGWWCLTANRDGAEREHQGKKYPVKERSTLWVFVDEKK